MSPARARKLRGGERRKLSKAEIDRRIRAVVNMLFERWAREQVWVEEHEVREYIVRAHRRRGHWRSTPGKKR